MTMEIKELRRIRTFQRDSKNAELKSCIVRNLIAPNSNRHAELLPAICLVQKKSFAVSTKVQYDS